MKIGVFDSGVGGLSVARSIQKALPEHEILLREDKARVPYGNRAADEILGFVTPIFEAMVNDGCQVIVVACNTVTTLLIAQLRELFDVPLVAIEPMVKPAALATKSGVIAVCATPATLSSQRYDRLKQEHAKEVRVLEPDCSDWATMIENRDNDHRKIERRINEVLDAGADVIVLACTHFHWIEEEIEHLAAGKAKVLQPEAAIVAQLKRVLERLP
jgi:glutamate racemase